MQLLKRKYQKLGSNPGFDTLRANSALMAIWDDHDYGQNDAGAEYPQKEASRQIMLDFWQAPKDSPRRTRVDGIYTAQIFGEGEQRIQIILPDLRWNRVPLSHVSEAEYDKRKDNNMGPYLKSTDPNASMLGEKQWQWLEQELLKTASIKIIGSSLQLVADYTGWEAWANFPADRDRLFRFIKQHKINGVMVISGDTHWGEISRYQQDLDYPIWDITSSGLSEEWKQVSPNRHRVSEYTAKANYGKLQVDWQQDDPSILVSLQDSYGAKVITQSIKLSSISPY